MKVKDSFCNAIFCLIIILAVCELIHTNDYITNLANAVIFPLFLMSIVDTIYKSSGKACQLLLEKKYKYEVEFTEARVTCNLMKGFEFEETQKIKKDWENKLEKEAMNILFIEHCEKIVKNWFKWYVPLYTIILVYLFLSLAFSQSYSWIALTNYLNNDSITFWTFALVLFDIIFTEKIAQIIVGFAEKAIHKQNNNVEV